MIASINAQKRRLNRSQTKQFKTEQDLQRKQTQSQAILSPRTANRNKWVSDDKGKGKKGKRRRDRSDQNIQLQMNTTKDLFPAVNYEFTDKEIECTDWHSMVHKKGRLQRSQMVPKNLLRQQHQSRIQRLNMAQIQLKNQEMNKRRGSANSSLSPVNPRASQRSQSQLVAR